MATSHFARTVYQGRSGDGMAAQRVDYITRQGAYSPAEARIRHQGLHHGTELEREDLVYWRARNLPDWAQDDPVRYFHAAGSSPSLRSSAKARHTRPKCVFAGCVHFVDHTPYAGSV
jgi:hypothetical protein